MLPKLRHASSSISFEFTPLATKGAPPEATNPFALIFVMLYETTFGPLLSLPKTKPSGKSLHIVTI